MASNHDAGIEVRQRNRRRVRTRKTTAAAETTTTTSTADDVAATNDNVRPSEEAVGPELGAAEQNDSTDPLTPAAVLVDRQRTPVTMIKDSIDDHELTSPPRSEVADNGELGVQPLPTIDDTALNGGSHRLPEDSPSRVPDDAPKQSRGKRKVKNKGRKVAEVTNESAMDHPMNSHEGAGDRFTDDTALNDGSHPPPNDSPSYLLQEVPKKSKGKSRVKNKGRKVVEATNEMAMDHPLNGHEGTSDWFTAVRSADIATIRRLAESEAVDINSTNEVSRNNNQQQT